MKYKIMVLLFFTIAVTGWNWGNFSLETNKAFDDIKIVPRWVVDTVGEDTLRLQLTDAGSPLITENLVIQGNLINGVRAYKKTTGKPVWSVGIKSGVFSPVVLHNRSLYFGGGDGFFYSLQLNTGILNWKFFTHAGNFGTPVVYKNKIYWISDQTLHAFSLKGQKLWIYAPEKKLFVGTRFALRGGSGVAVYKNLVYAAFSNGQIVALNADTGEVKWKKNLSASHSIREDLKVSGNCVFVPVYDFNLFCLHLLKGTVIWKAKGGSFVALGKYPGPSKRALIYQSYRDKLYALDRDSGKIVWEKSVKNAGFALSPAVVKDYLLYGFPSTGSLIFAEARGAHTAAKYKFGRGLAARVSIDKNGKDVYFFSIDGYLHKISVL